MSNGSDAQNFPMTRSVHLLVGRSVVRLVCHCSFVPYESQLFAFRLEYVNNCIFFFISGL